MFQEKLAQLEFSNNEEVKINESKLYEQFMVINIMTKLDKLKWKFKKNKAKKQQQISPNLNKYINIVKEYK